MKPFRFMAVESIGIAEHLYRERWGDTATFWSSAITDMREEKGEIIKNKL